MLFEKIQTAAIHYLDGMITVEEMRAKIIQALMDEENEKEFIELAEALRG